MVFWMEALEMPTTNETGKHNGVHDIKANDWVRTGCLQHRDFNSRPSVFPTRGAPFLIAYAFTDDDGGNV